MFKKILQIFLPKEQPNTYCEDNWHLDILKFSIEEVFLESKFPKEIEITEWIDTKPSKIDRKFYDISWVVEANSIERSGLFIVSTR